MRLLAFILFFASAAAMAADCRLSGSVCVDASAIKNISGISVTLAEVGGCWEYENTYTCLMPNAVNYCQPFVNAQPACWQTFSQCSQIDTMFNTGCMRYLQTWRCGNPATPTPANTIRLSDTYTLISSNYDPGPCQSLSSNPNCQIAESRCASTAPPSLPPGINPSQVAPDGCFQRQNTYVCLTGAANTSECDGYASNPNCTLQSSRCDPADTLNGQCTFETKTYKCMSVPPKTSTVTDCLGQMFCQDGKCFDRGYENDTDFARTMVLMEAAREAGVYGTETEIFKGFNSRCNIKLFGLVNCCKKSGAGSGMSNASMASNALKAGKFFGSPYMYDAMFASDVPWLVNKAIDAWSATAWTSTTSFYGLNFSFSPVAGLKFVSFDPYTFALQIGLMILSDMLSCEQQEQILAMRRGQNLCVEVGTYCSRRLPIVRTCIQKTKSFCCYNSRLARIINEQGRGQIGRSWGSAESPNCSGFTQAEFAAIDFSRIDMSEFTAEIMANIKMPNVGSMSQQVNTSVQQKLQNYYQR